MTKNLIMIFTSVVLGVLGQLSMKHGMSGVKLSAVSPVKLLQGFFHALLNLYVIGGFALYALSAMVWLVILSRVELSFAYPLISTGYIAVVFLSWLLFHEHVTLIRVAGTLVICAGVYLITRS